MDYCVPLVAIGLVVLAYVYKDKLLQLVGKETFAEETTAAAEESNMWTSTPAIIGYVVVGLLLLGLVVFLMMR